MTRKLTAEFLGTCWLVLGGCGTAVLAAGHGSMGWLGVSFAFGLSVLTMAYAIGHVSGCHLNPAVTIGLATAGRHPKNEVLGYVLAQVLGALAGALLINIIASGVGNWHVTGFEGEWSAAASGFATNGFGEHSPVGASMLACLVTEVVLTAFFLVVILGSTSRLASPAQAGIAIGLCLTLIHLISIPITNTSVNPARSTGPAIVAGGPALKQLWLFWLAPIVGAVLGALLHNLMEPRVAPDEA